MRGSFINDYKTYYKDTQWSLLFFRYFQTSGYKNDGLPTIFSLGGEVSLSTFQNITPTTDGSLLPVRIQTPVHREGQVGNDTLEVGH